MQDNGCDVGTNFLPGPDDHRVEGGTHPVAQSAEEKKQSTRDKAHDGSSTGASAAAPPPTGGPHGLSAFLKDNNSRTADVLDEGEKLRGDALGLIEAFPDYKHSRKFQYVVVKDEREVVCVAALKLGSMEQVDLELAYIHTRKDAEKQGHASCALAHGPVRNVNTSGRTLKVMVADAAGTKKACSLAQGF